MKEVDTKAEELYKFSAEEIEFLSEETLVTIEPTTSIPRLELLTGTWGPFVPPQPLEVPIWLAVTLRRKQLAKITLPAWMTKEALEQVIAEESAPDAEQRFTPVPWHYLEIAKQICEVARDDLPPADDIPALVETLYTRRANKIRMGLRSVGADPNKGAHGYEPMRLDNISAMEINAFRPLLTGALDKLWTLARTRARMADGAATNNNPFNNNPAAPGAQNGAGGTGAPDEEDWLFGDDSQATSTGVVGGGSVAGAGAGGGYVPQGVQARSQGSTLGGTQGDEENWPFSAEDLDQSGASGSTGPSAKRSRTIGPSQ